MKGFTVSEWTHLAHGTFVQLLWRNRPKIHLGPNISGSPPPPHPLLGNARKHPFLREVVPKTFSLIVDSIVFGDIKTLLAFLQFPSTMDNNDIAIRIESIWFEVLFLNPPPWRIRQVTSVSLVFCRICSIVNSSGTLHASCVANS